MSQSERLLNSSKNPVDKVEVVVIPRELRSLKPEVHYSLGLNEERLSVHRKSGSTGVWLQVLAALFHVFVARLRLLSRPT